MGLGPLNPGCTCCTCNGWTGTPPLEMQLTLPSSCVRSGAHLLDTTSDSFDPVNYCPTDHLSSICQSWWTWDGDTLIVISVGDDESGQAILVAAICSEGCGNLGQDCGNMWKMSVAHLSDWGDLDALSVPFSDNDLCTDCGGIANCTGTPDDALVDLPP